MQIASVARNEEKFGSFETVPSFSASSSIVVVDLPIVTNPTPLVGVPSSCMGNITVVTVPPAPGLLQRMVYVVPWILVPIPVKCVI